MAEEARTHEDDGHVSKELFDARMDRMETLIKNSILEAKADNARLESKINMLEIKFDSELQVLKAKFDSELEVIEAKFKSKLQVLDAMLDDRVKPSKQSLRDRLMRLRSPLTK